GPGRGAGARRACRGPRQRRAFLCRRRFRRSWFASRSGLMHPARLMTTGSMSGKPAGGPGEVLHFDVSPDDAGARLDKWLSERVENLTRSRLKALIEAGALTRGGEAFDDPSWKIREGEAYRLAVPPLAPAAPQGEAIDLDIRYEDADLIVVHKPAGLVVHPASGNWTGTLVNALIAHCGTSLSGVGGVARP